MKGEYPQVIYWLKEVYNSIIHFTDLLKKEEFKAIIVVLNNLKGGLYSKDKDVTIWTIKILGKIISNFQEPTLRENFWNWFVSVNGGLEGTVYCMQKHPDIKKEALEMLIEFGPLKDFDIFSKYFKNIVNNNTEYWRMILSYLEDLSTLNFEGNENLLDFWLENAFSTAENEARKSVEERSICLSILCEMWRYFPERIEKNESIANRLLSAMKRGVRDKNSALQHFALALQIALLEDFALEKKTFAPNLYKSLVFTLLETHQQEQIREFLMANLSIIYQDIIAIPISILIEPFGKLVQISENSTYFFNNFDLSFLSVLCKHSKLNYQNSVQLFDLIARFILNNGLFFKKSKSILNVLISNLIHQDQNGIDLIKKFISVYLFFSHYLACF